MTHISPKISNRQFATWGPCIRTPKRALHKCSHLNQLTSLIGQFSTYGTKAGALNLSWYPSSTSWTMSLFLSWPKLNFYSPCLASCWQQKPAIFHPFCGFCFSRVNASFLSSFLSRNWIMLTLNPSSHNPKVLVSL